MCRVCANRKNKSYYVFVHLENAGKVLKDRKGFRNAGKVLKMQERFYKVMGKVLKLWERFCRREKVGKVSKFQERLFNDNFKAGNGEERKGKGKLSVPPLGNVQ